MRRKQKKEGCIAYAEIKGCVCECAVLRACWRANQQRCLETGAFNDRTVWTSEVKFWYSLLPSDSSGKYRETEGVKDYDQPGSAKLNQYGLEGVSSSTPNYYERVYKTNGTQLPWIENSGGLESDAGGGAKKYTFSAGTATGGGFSETSSDRVDNVRNWGAEVIHERVLSIGGSKYLPSNPTPIYDISITTKMAYPSGQRININLASYGIYNVYDCTSWDYFYLTSDVQTDYIGIKSNSIGVSGGGGSVTVHPVTKYDQYAIRPASLTTVAPHYETRTFLVKD